MPGEDPLRAAPVEMSGDQPEANEEDRKMERDWEDEKVPEGMEGLETHVPTKHVEPTALNGKKLRVHLSEPKMEKEGWFGST